MAVTGGWKRRAVRGAQDPPRHPGIDPEHASPVDAPDPTMGDLTGAPGLPAEWAGGQYLQGPVASEYVDLTPVDHMHGLGALPGVSLEDAQARAGRVRSEDWGADDQRSFERPRYQEHGRRHTEMVSQGLGGASPETLRYQVEGVESPIDPHARHNRRVARWHEPGPVDMHWYGPEKRPRYLKTATGSRERDAVPARTQHVSPFGAGRIERPDNWAPAVVRRSPRDWSESSAVDAAPQPGADFGLGSWGL